MFEKLMLKFGYKKVKPRAKRGTSAKTVAKKAAAKRTAEALKPFEPPIVGSITTRS